jgi:hypothetical protein
MSTTVSIRCRCGQVTGRAEGVSPTNTNRAVCYCVDCQAFAHAIGRADLLDPAGGSDIVQLAPAALRIDSGMEHVACLRLSPKGLYRFYSRCCSTPLGNVLNTRVPFVGIERQAFQGELGAAFGPARFTIKEESATRAVPKPSPLRMAAELARVAGLLLGWKLGGRSFPHPFYERGATEPKVPVRLLSRDEREALRPLCGPGARTA